jgi:hypothetical protein
LNTQEELTSQRLLDKSQEAFLLAIELYNRPTIRYHAEGCCFFLCNAWELMLKAYLITRDGGRSVYYSDSDRTLSLSDCLKRVFTNENDPLRRNMDVVMEFRNTSTHFVTTEYELFYGPVLQQSVHDYEEKLRELHGIEISDRIPENYLALSVRRGTVEPDAIKARYPREVVEKMLQLGSSIAASRMGMEGLTYSTELRITKKKGAGIPVRISNEADPKINIVKMLTDPIDKYIFRTKTAVAFIRRKLAKEGITLLVKSEPKEFNNFHFQVFVDFYNMKGNEAYSYDLSLGGEQPSWCYSQQAIDLMLQEIRRNPEHIIDSMRAELARRKKLN